ncbi:MAG: 2-C-methyl-D-erythritol 2,4-cyclodiphosphate synthase [Defluviitaleaceae bacterium]|nr:2-C-methyl-D-erythritol 2,4-cyclodiphosphate synthase [Defluviitaleaceae bacterium]
MRFSIGHGYDVHKLVENRPLILGGVEIPFEKGLLGHSDADVLTHAIMDALLGAAGLGDIGQSFPDTDTAYKGACSIDLLKKVYEKLSENSWMVESIDATILAQAPKLAPYKVQMIENIATAIGTSVSTVNIKATTEEGLGFTGTGKGIAAHAVCLISIGL